MRNRGNGGNGNAVGNNGVRNVLIASVGMSPAVVTETLWALMNPHEQPDDAWRNEPPFVAHEIHVVTTALGRKRMQGNALQDRVRELYAQQGAAEPMIHIDVPRDAEGREIEDISTAAENSAFADFVTELVRRHTADDATRVHVSLAGGRKTMTSFTHAAMTYFGRPQDRLSHVLVDPPVLEQCPDFWWPGQPEEEVLTRGGARVSTAVGEARVGLVETPYVRLRHLIDMEGMPTPISHAELVQRLQEALQAQHLVLHFGSCMLRIGRYAVKLSPREFALYATLASALKERWAGAGDAACVEHRGWLTHDDLLTPDHPAARRFLTLYEEVGGVEKAAEWSRKLCSGVADDATDLRNRLNEDKARINGKIGGAIRELVIRNRVRVHAHKLKNRKTSHFGLLLEPHQIEFDRNL